MYLAIETSTQIGSVAVGNRDGVLAEAELGVQSKHSEQLLPAIDPILKQAQVGKQDLTRLVVGGGPGSFTGLRISAAAAKAFSHALNVPLFAYSGLASLAAGQRIADRPICAMFDARRGEVYVACYRFPGLTSIETLLPPAARKHADVLDLIDANETVIIGPDHLAVPRASALIWLSDIDPAGQVSHVAAWEPLYLRESGAERMRSR